MTALPPVGSPACGCRCRRSGRTAGGSPGCGGTTGCFPRWRWPSASAGSWPPGSPPGPALPRRLLPRRRQPGGGSDPCPPGAAERTTDGYPGGIALLRLTPDQLVRDRGRQLGLWGDAVVTDRVARAAVRVQAMLGHDAVTRPVPAGGRSPDEQVTLVPYGGGDDRMLPPSGRAGQVSRAALARAGRAGPGRGGSPRRRRPRSTRPRCPPGSPTAPAPRWPSAGGAWSPRRPPGCRPTAPRGWRSPPGPGRGRSPSGGGIRAPRAGGPDSSWSPRTGRPGWWPCRRAAG